MTPRMTGSDWRILGKSVAAVAAAWLFAGVFTALGMGPWFAALVKPALNPPSALFSPVWATLYALQMAALFLLWRQSGPTPGACRATVIFWVALWLNALWSLCFFTLRQPWLGLIEIGLYLFVLAKLVKAALPVSRTAAALIAPTLAWVAFATYLNFEYWRLN